MSVPTLDIDNLRLGFRSHAGLNEVLHGISLTVAPGETVALVGESGSGKSVTARLVLGLLQEQKNARVSGRIAFAEKPARRAARASAGYSVVVHCQVVTPGISRGRSISGVMSLSPSIIACPCRHCKNSRRSRSRA